jgi:phosphoribosyl 1,2-cyclic phosphate phosphodiesterase
MPLRITVLGSGTSSGVPTIGCRCEVCRSSDPRDKRLRPSVLVQYDGRNILVDTTPDFREQVLRIGLERLDAILYTHAHADHILGLDDVRPFNFFQKSPIPLYATEATFSVIRRVFAYAFAEGESESSRPKLELHTLDGAPFPLFGRMCVPVRLEHGKGECLGFRFGRAAYLTDHSAIPEESRPLLEGLDVLFLDALRRRPHPTHTTLEQAVALVEQLRPQRAFLTHMCHDLGHAQTEAELPPHIRLAYDGLVVDVEEE